MRFRAPWIKFLPPFVILNIATLGRIGYWGKAPGTNGSFAGIIFYTIVFFSLKPFAYFILAALLIYISIPICGEAEILMRKRDPSEVIFDEFVAIPVCFIGLHPEMDQYGVWLVMLPGFLLFRFFDIVKPLGIKRLQKLEGGLGVVVDDLAAGIATCVSLHVIFWAWGRFI